MDIHIKALQIVIEIDSLVLELKNLRMEYFESLTSNIEDIVTLLPSSNREIRNRLGITDLKKQNGYLEYYLLKNSQEKYEHRNLIAEGFVSSNLTEPTKKIKGFNNVSLGESDFVIKEDPTEQMMPIWKACQSNLGSIFKEIRKIVDTRPTGIRQADLARMLSLDKFFKKETKENNWALYTLIEIGVKQKILAVRKEGKQKKFILPGTVLEYKPQQLIFNSKVKTSASRAESNISQFLLQKGFQFQSQKTFPTLKGNNRLLKFDFHLPAQLKTRWNEILIEVQGRQHYEPVDFFGGIETFLRQIEYDQRKRIFCKNEDIKLIEIPYWEDEVSFFQRAIKLKPVKINVMRK